MIQIHKSNLCSKAKSNVLRKLLTTTKIVIKKQQQKIDVLGLDKKKICEVISTYKSISQIKYFFMS